MKLTPKETVNCPEIRKGATIKFLQHRRKIEATQKFIDLPPNTKSILGGKEHNKP